MITLSIFSLLYYFQKMIILAKETLTIYSKARTTRNLLLFVFAFIFTRKDLYNNDLRHFVFRYLNHFIIIITLNILILILIFYV